MTPGARTVTNQTTVRLQRLIEANRAIVAELGLDALLEQIVESARLCVGAEYAALKVVGNSGTSQQFIHAGLDPDAVVAFNQQPGHQDLLDSLLDGEQPTRRRFSGDDPRWSEFPTPDSPISSFVGVPLQSANAAYGSLYLANRIGAPEFSLADQELLAAVAATASIAIENARLYTERNRRQEWLSASTELSHSLLDSEGDTGSVLQRIAESMQRLAPADKVAVLLPMADNDLLEVAVATGEGATQALGLRYLVQGSVAERAMRDGGLIITDADRHQVVGLPSPSGTPVTQIMALALQGDTSPRGVIVAVRTTRDPFFPADLEMAETFAHQATLALEFADARQDRHRLAVLEDHARIARDLHDHVLQKVFAAGLTVQGTAAMLPEGKLRERLTRSVGNLDDTIRSLRTSILELQERDPLRASVRSRVLRVLGELIPPLGFAPTLKFEGPLETMLNEPLADEIEAVVRELLANIAIHAQATNVTVRVHTDGERLTVTVTDNGVGMGSGVPRSGLVQLDRRAERLGGFLELGASETGGLRAHWSVPI